MYAKGTIKLTWINPKNYSILESEMFKSVSDALSNLPKSKGNNWLIFELIDTDGKKYHWKLLPYGKYKGYLWGMKFRDNPILRYGTILIMIYGVYSLYNLMIEE